MHRSLVFEIALVAVIAVPCMSSDLPRAEYPRPDFERAEWLSLNGTWEFQFDDPNEGLSAKWYSQKTSLPKKILVPYCFQSRLSGIADTSFHDVMWYRRTFRIPQEWKGRRVRLNFGAVDYRCQVWLNGDSLGSHEGGQTPFSFDVTAKLLSSAPGDNALVVRAEDPSTDRSIPRGKQYWEPKSRSIWYTRTSGIWQPVWLEAVPDPHIENVLIRPNVDESSVGFTARVSRLAPDMRLRVRVDFNGELQGAAETPCTGERSAVLI